MAMVCQRVSTKKVSADLGASRASRRSRQRTKRSLRNRGGEAQHGPAAGETRLGNLRSRLGSKVSEVERHVHAGRTFDATDGVGYSSAFVALARRRVRGSADCLFECCRAYAQSFAWTTQGIYLTRSPGGAARP